jgi:hypothetical protein
MRAPPCGEDAGIECPCEDDSIGFYVGWTARGLRITSIEFAGHSAA